MPPPDLTKMSTADLLEAQQVNSRKRAEAEEGFAATGRAIQAELDRRTTLDRATDYLAGLSPEDRRVVLAEFGKEN